MFQSLTRNPLGSPDIIGFSTGAYTGGIVTIILFGTSFVSTAAGAIIGGMLTALLVYLLTWKGGVQGFRLIIVGIALAFAAWHSQGKPNALIGRMPAILRSGWTSGRFATVMAHLLAAANLHHC